MGKSGKRDNENQRLLAKYSAAAFQMAAIIVLGALGGVYLDDYLQCSVKICTVVCTTVAVLLSVYVTIKDLIK